MKNNIKARIYEHYVDSWNEVSVPETLSGFKSREPTLMGIIDKFFPRDLNAKIIDLGCGHGAFLHFANKAGYKNIRGVDVSLQQVTAAQSLGIESVEHGDLLDVLASIDSFSHDVVIAFDVIEHFTKDELVKFIDELNRIMKAGAVLLVHVPNAESPFGAAVRYGDMTHEQAFTRTSIEQLFRAFGFNSVKCYESGPIPHGLISFSRFIIWKIIRLILRFCTIVETGNMSGSALFTRNLLAVIRK